MLAHVHDLTEDGEGVGRLPDGLVVFVPGALPGEQAEVRVTERRGRFARAQLEHLRTVSPDRVRPVCPVFGRCGGCDLQHLSYPAQLAAKTRRVEEALRRIGGLEVSVRPCLPSPSPFRYRHKASWPVQPSPGGGFRAGFYMRGTHRVVEVDDCAVQEPASLRTAQAIFSVLAEHRIPAFDETAGQGMLRHVVVRASRARGQTMAVLVSGAPALPHEEELVREMFRRAPDLTSLWLSHHPDRSNRILGGSLRHLGGETHLEERVGPLRFRLSPASFFQVNPQVAERLYEEVLEQAALTGTETVVDLFAGTGVIALWLARSAGLAVGVEMEPAAVEDALRAARENGIANCRFVCADAAQGLRDLRLQGVRPQVVVLDPPRKGAAECLPALLELRPDRVVYVSCDPATLARDARELAAAGYRPGEAVPMDMFPQTMHVETVLSFSRA